MTCSENNQRRIPSIANSPYFLVFSRSSMRPTFCYTCCFLFRDNDTGSRTESISVRVQCDQGERGSPLKRSELQNDSLRRFSLRFDRKGQRPMPLSRTRIRLRTTPTFCTQWIGSSRSLFLAAPRYTFCTKNRGHIRARTGGKRGNKRGEKKVQIRFK